MKAVNVNPAWKVWDKEWLSCYIDEQDRAWSHYVSSVDGDCIFFGDWAGHCEEPNARPLEIIRFSFGNQEVADLYPDEAREFAQAILDIVGKK